MTQFFKRGMAKTTPALLHRAAFIFFIMVMADLAPNLGASPNEKPNQKNLLIQQIDSLDMEKQLRKRKGESIEDLEKASALLKDSVAVIKKEIGLTALPVEQAPQQNNASTVPAFLSSAIKFIPKNPFDWIVVAVGFVALLAGVILCIGLVGMLFKKPTVKKKMPLKPLHDLIAQQTTSGHKEPPAGNLQADIADRKADFLRLKISAENHTDFQFDNKTLRPQTEPKAALTAIDLKNQIVLAAKSGSDVSVISKKFQVSLDQVTLILRVARQESDNNS